MSERYSEFRQAEIGVVVLTYDSRETLTRFVEKYSIPYTMLSDPDSIVIRRYGIFNDELEVGSKYHGVPYPGVFLADEDGVIRAKFAEENYRDRPLLDDMLEAISTLPDSDSR